MKATLYLLFSLIMVLSWTSCEDVTNLYPGGIDAASRPTANQAITDSLTAADYTTLSKTALKKATTKADSAAAKSIDSKKALNATYDDKMMIPVFLSKYRAADPNSTAKVSFNYFDGAAIVADTISPFACVSPTVWAYDPTVKYTMTTSDDYLLIVNVVQADPTLNTYVTKDKSGNISGETYYGSSSSYKNFTVTASAHINSGDPAFAELSDAQASKLTYTRLQEGMIVFLQQKFPDAVPQTADGLTMYYVVTAATYGGTKSPASLRFQCTKAGTPASFKFVDGDNPVK